jgi:hypothetical protein
VGLELHTVNGQWFRFRMQARPEGDAFRLRVGTGEEFTVQPETSGALEEAYSAVFKELTRLARTPDERPEKEFGFRTGTLQ